MLGARCQVVRRFFLRESLPSRVGSGSGAIERDLKNLRIGSSIESNSSIGFPIELELSSIGYSSSSPCSFCCRKGRKMGGEEREAEVFGLGEVAEREEEGGLWRRRILKY